MNANEMMGELVAKHKADIIDKAGNKLASRLAKICMPDAEKLFRKAVEEGARKKAEQVLADFSHTTFRQTDHYGCPRGEPTMSLLEVVLAETRKWLEVKVDSYGRSTNSGSTRDRPRAQWLIGAAAESLVKTELEPAIKQAKDDLKAEVEKRLASVFVQTLRKLT